MPNISLNLDLKHRKESSTKIEIDIRDNITPSTALNVVRNVVEMGKISIGEKGKKYYCWATSFTTEEGDMMVYTRQYRKNDCFLVCKYKR